MKKNITNKKDVTKTAFLKRHLFFVACLCFVLAVWSIRLAATQAVTVGNSDEVAQQNILADWQHGLHQQATMGDDNWFFKFPLYVLTNNLPINPVLRLTITRWVLLAATAALTLWVLFAFIKRLVSRPAMQKYSLMLLALFLASIPQDAFVIFKMPNSRNIEIGIVLFLFLQLYRYLYDDTWAKKHTRLKIAGLVLLTGSLLADDPLFLYFGLVPLVVAAIGLYIFNAVPRKTAQNIGLFAGASAATYVFVKHVIIFVLPLGFLAHEGSLATYKKFLENLGIVFTYGIRSVGINFWGAHYMDTRTIMSALFLLVISVVTAGIVRQYRVLKKPFFLTFMLVVVFINIAVVVTSDVLMEGNVSRYLIMLTPLGLLALTFVATTITMRRQQIAMVSILVMLCLLTVGTSIRTLAHRQTSPPYQEQFLDILKQHGLTKGYADYWNAGITTHLSGQTIHVLPAICNPQEQLQLQFLNILTERAAIMELHPKNSFYMYSNQYGAMCTAQQLEPILGRPEKLITTNDEAKTTIAIYNYDISTKVVH